MKTHKKLNTKSEIPEFQRIDFVEKIVATVDRNFPKFSNTETAGKVSFVENKPVNQERISDFLQPSKKNNRWSNRGPAWFALAASYEMFFSNLSGKDVIPCANGGIALQAMANLMSLKAGRQLRWCISSFGFSNTSRSPFSNAIFVDCDENGVLDLNEVSRVPAEELDGIVLTNPFGQAKDFTRFADWCKANDKALLIDNAAGIASDIPDLPYQSFSLHHTKPFGFGEGGLAVIPSDDRETFLSLMEYTPIETAVANLWITNGKLSDLACASQVARLEASPNWLPLYRMQSERILSIGEKFNFRPLLPIQTPATSVPLLAEFPICRNSLVNDAMVLAKYYKPLASTTRCQDIFNRIVNIPVHPDVAQLTNVDIEKLFQKIIDANSDG